MNSVPDAPQNMAADTGWTSAGTALTATVSGLDNGTQYAFEVRAVNGVGNSRAVGTTAWRPQPCPMLRRTWH